MYLIKMHNNIINNNSKQEKMSTYFSSEKNESKSLLKEKVSIVNEI